jgi:hypothetical protein
MSEMSGPPCDQQQEETGNHRLGEGIKADRRNGMGAPSGVAADQKKAGDHKEGEDEASLELGDHRQRV